MMEGIRSQREELTRLERKAEEVDIRRDAADKEARKIEQNNNEMKTTIDDLSNAKNDLEMEIEMRRLIKQIYETNVLKVLLLPGFHSS